MKKLLFISMIMLSVSVLAQKQTINRGTPNGHNGDTPYVMAGKCIHNFAELYSSRDSSAKVLADHAPSWNRSLDSTTFNDFVADSIDSQTVIRQVTFAHFPAYNDTEITELSGMQVGDAILNINSGRISFWDGTQWIEIANH